MANRRQLDSSQHHVAILRNTYFQYHTKTLLLTLAFVSLLISIHCASFGHRSVDQQQQHQHHNKQWPHNQPDYRLLSETTKDDIDLDDILNYGSYAGSAGRRPELDINIEELEQSLKDSYSHPSTPEDHQPSSASSSSSSSTSASYSHSPDEDVDQLYSQLLTARRLFKDQSRASHSPSPSSSSALVSLDDYLPNLATDPISSASSSNAGDTDELSDFSNAKLIELLLQDEKKLSLSPRLGAAQNDDYDSKYDNPKNPLYFLPDHQYVNDDDDKITLSLQQGDEASHTTIDGGGSQGDQGAKVTYNLSIEGSDEMNKNDDNDVAEVSTTKSHRNLTTLVEDELLTNTGSGSTETNGQQQVNVTTPATLDAASAASSATGSAPEPTVGQAPSSSSYGYIVTKDTKPELHDKSYSMSAMFYRLYDKLASYLPNFMRASESPKKEVSHNTAATPGASPMTILKSTTSSRDNGSGRDNSSSSSSTSDNQDKQGTPKTDSDSQLAHNGKDKDASMPAEVTSAAPNEDSLDSSKMGIWNIMGSENDDKDDDDDGDSSVESSTSSSSSSNGAGTNIKRLVSVGEATRPLRGSRKGHKVSLLRESSSLVLPIKSNDELIIQSESVTHPDSLLGKYIYAPEHHYHLNTLAAATQQPSSSSSKQVDIDDEQQMYTQMSQRSYMRRLHPGDSVYSSYGGFNPMYDALGPQGGPIGHHGIGNNKSNDVYFLAMVGSFCAMAMAVVLAAGLFAYRVQQQRKSSSETDYPTYGVVGPNSMNGKCGAASFVGGYFGSGHGGPGSSSTCGSSKTGSVKHLADLYCSDSVVASGANGLGNNNNHNKANKKATSEQNNTAGNNNSNNFMANQNAARMYHYQHQKQQMIISDRNSAGRHASASDLDSEDENDDGTYTVYECPGLASAHEMEIKNPLFNDDQTP